MSRIALDGKTAVVIGGTSGRKSPRIINIASLSSFVGLYHVAGYAASKAALASLTADSARFVNGEVLVVDGGFLASGVNQ